MPVVAHHQGPCADRCPDIGMCTLLADPGLVREPDFYRSARRFAGERRAHQAREVLLKVASASASFFGCTGRGCNRTRPNSPSQAPIVLSCTSTDQRRATSARRSTHRQRVTLCTVGSGPWITKSRNSSLWAAVRNRSRPGLLRDFSPYGLPTQGQEPESGEPAGRHGIAPKPHAAPPLSSRYVSLSLPCPCRQTPACESQARTIESEFRPNGNPSESQNHPGLV